MPSVSKSQARLMRGAANNPSFAKKVGVSPKVAKEFVREDHGKSQKRLPERKGK